MKITHQQSRILFRATILLPDTSKCNHQQPRIISCPDFIRISPLYRPKVPASLQTFKIFVVASILLRAPSFDM